MLYSFNPDSVPPGELCAAAVPPAQAGLQEEPEHTLQVPQHAGHEATGAKPAALVTPPPLHPHHHHWYINNLNQ